MAKKNEDNQQKDQSQETSIFQQELSKIPKEIGDTINKRESYLRGTVNKIKEILKDKEIGFFLAPEVDSQNPQQPNFEKLTLWFIMDDFEKPIKEFSPEFLFGEEFNNYLVKKTEKDSNGEEYPAYFLKENEEIRFEGTSISHVREECFDNKYDTLRRLGSSIVYSDPRNFLMALKTIEIHKNMVLNKFEKYVVVYAGVGSWVRGEKSNDFDVFMVIDDTDVKTMPRYQVKEQLTRIIYDLSGQVAQVTGIQLHIQAWLLTDTWDFLKNAHPVMFTFLRDGVPFFDRGIFNSWKELLKLGKVKPSPEAIDMHMNMGNQLLDSARQKLKDIAFKDIYNAVLSPAQAILMLWGFNPTTPKETVELFRDVLYNKEQVITEKELKTLETIRELFKNIEHDENYKVSGKEIDKLMKDSESFLKKIKKLFEKTSEERTKDSILSIYNEIMGSLKELGIEEDILNNFESFVKENKLPSFTVKSLKQVMKSKEDYDNGKLTVSEVNKAIKEGRNLLSELKKVKEEQMLKLEKSKKLIIRTGDELYELKNIDGYIYLDGRENSYLLKSGEFKKQESKQVSSFNHKDVEFDEVLFKALKNFFGEDKFTIVNS